MTKDKFERSFKSSKEEIKNKYYSKTNLDQLMKTFEQGTNRKINDICQLNLSRKEKEREITFKPFTEKIIKSPQMLEKVKNSMKNISTFLEKYFYKKQGQIKEEPI